jgi:hypothetical protein
VKQLTENPLQTEYCRTITVSEWPQRAILESLEYFPFGTNSTEWRPIVLECTMGALDLHAYFMTVFQWRKIQTTKRAN